MENGLITLFDSLLFIFRRLNWLSIIDLLLVTLIFFTILRVLRETQAIVLLRGVLVLVVLVSLLRSLDVLPAFSWLIQTTLPTLLLAIPVIFAPEIRRALEQIGRAGTLQPSTASEEMLQAVGAIVTAAARLSDRRHGALIVLRRHDQLDEYISTGANLDSKLTAELLLQIFYPNTPLHDGAAIIGGGRFLAAACVMPLSASGVLTRTPDRRLGLRHRAALGLSEISDAAVVVVSEETGTISVVNAGRIIRRLDSERLDNILRTFFRPPPRPKGLRGWIKRLLPESARTRKEIGD